jgi:trans-aconitate methyltransferase
MKSYSEACERNASPIYEVLTSIIPDRASRLLEIGSGTGQHAFLLAPKFPKLTWVTSDVPANHPGIREWISLNKGGNIEGPFELEVGINKVQAQNFDFVYSANVLHIMSWDLAKKLFSDLSQSMESGSQLLLYGPFNYGGKFTSASNQDFDQYLKSKFPLGGIRDFEEVLKLANLSGLGLIKDFEMPSNNRFLQFQKG